MSGGLWGSRGQFARGGDGDGRRLHAICDFNGRCDRDGRPMGDRDFVSVSDRPKSGPVLAMDCCKAAFAFRGHRDYNGSGSPRCTPIALLRTTLQLGQPPLWR